MLELKACTVCFSTDVKLFNMDTGQLRQTFNALSGLQTYEGNGMPSYLCLECTSYVRRFKKFRLKCQTANYVLREIIQRNSEIKIEDLKLINREALNIAPTLSFVNQNKAYFEEVKFRWTRSNRLGLPCKEEIPVVNYNNYQVTEENNDNGKTIKIENEINEELNDYGELNMHDDCDANDEIIEESINNEETDEPPLKNAKTEDDVDGSEIDAEYAKLYPITMKEAEAVAEIFKMCGTGIYKCEICSKSYNNENRLTTHLRMHDMHTSGTFRCDLCMYYYRTEFMLKTHMADKHMYKYVCRKCPEVSYTRALAKHHYTHAHLNKRYVSGSKWSQVRPLWLGSRGVKCPKGATKKKRKKDTGIPPDFPLREAVSQEEQYRLVLERKSSRNYLESQFTCDLCFKGFRVLATYNNHMAKHDPKISGKHQCDVCKMFFKDTRKMYKHMIISHVVKYTCQLCKHVCYNRNQAIMHYKWHKNVTYKCPHCDKVFNKISTHLTHIRIKHPSSFMCILCGHSFVSQTGLYCHQRIAHTAEETQLSSATEADPSHPLYCADCGIHFLNEDAFNTHLGSSNKHATTNESIKTKMRDTKRLGDKCTRSQPRGRRGRPSKAGAHSDIINNGLPTSTSCELCGKYLPNDVQTRNHYEKEHPGHDYLKRYMCDVCGHTTKQYANLVVHMRTHTNEKPYDCPHCDRRFSMGSNRDRHLVVHTGEKRYQCHHCNRRFTQSSAVKLHIQTVHLKIPYAPWDKKNRKRRKELEGASAPVSAASAPPQKLILDAQGDYLNAYINYNE
ncbi:zinc finger protein 135 [Amyelois transitella]|uniref:zinc finger protein 135 n=1 Tax=Amyelois transitella TaxID=680683 RepID=UPI00067DFC34|nr:zinc finger protein 135 [Amyelois transitella]